MDVITSFGIIGDLFHLARITQMAAEAKQEKRILKSCTKGLQNEQSKYLKGILKSTNLSYIFNL